MGCSAQGEGIYWQDASLREAELGGVGGRVMRVGGETGGMAGGEDGHFRLGRDRVDRWMD